MQHFNVNLWIKTQYAPVVARVSGDSDKHIVAAENNRLPGSVTARKWCWLLNGSTLVALPVQECGRTCFAVRIDNKYAVSIHVQRESRVCRKNV